MSRKANLILILILFLTACNTSTPSPIQPGTTGRGLRRSTFKEPVGDKEGAPAGETNDGKPKDNE